MALDLSKYGATPIATPQSNGNAPAQPSLPQRIWNDIATRGQANKDIYSAATSSGDTSVPNVVAGATKLVANTFGGIGDTIGELIKTVPGGSQALDAIGGAGSTAFKAVTDKLASTQLFKDAANHPEATKTLEKYLSTGQSLGDIANNILAAEGAKGAATKTSSLASKVADSIPAAPVAPAVSASNKVVDSLTQEWQKPIEAKSVAGFNKARDIVAKSPETPKFLSEQGIDPVAHIEDGKYATTDTADTLRTTAGKLSNDGLRPSLQHADYSTPKTPILDIKSLADTRATSEYGVTAADADTVTTNINKELEALQKKYPNGMSLTEMHDEGITYNQNGGYKALTSSDANKAIASRAIGSALKGLVEKKAPLDLPVHDYNQYLSKYYKAADYLDAISGKKAPVSFVQGLTRGAFKFGGAALAEHLAPGVVSAFAGYQIGKAIEHAIENLPNPLRARFIANLEITQPAAAKALQEYLAKTASGGGMAKLPAPSTIIPPAPTEATQMAGRAKTLAPK